MKHLFSYEVIYSSRRTVAIQITRDGQVKVRAPYHCPASVIEDFLTEKETWILKHLQKKAEEKDRSGTEQHTLTAQERSRYIRIARDVFTEKTAYYARIMGVTYGRISIREQKTRWGSCSSAGNLNYNWRLIFAPPEVLDYIVVHELAHRKEMNHSRAFYAIVESVLPDYKKAKEWLRDHGDSLYRAP